MMCCGNLKYSIGFQKCCISKVGVFGADFRLSSMDEVCEVEEEVMEDSLVHVDTLRRKR